MSKTPIEIAALRRDYTRATLLEENIARDPFEQFAHWFEEAHACEISEPNAMILATADAKGRPAARTVLLKSFDTLGFVFFTNYESRKGRELAQNPQASLLFAWMDLERQVRLEGHVDRTSAQESDDYFDSRPAESRLGAWASPQSQVVPDRAAIDQRFADARQQYGDSPPRRRTQTNNSAGGRTTTNRGKLLVATVAIGIPCSG
ncbi:MAG TPA: pyridoxamine 5'-phosphate oxidase, partial [Burkholderiales bacterium]|nr:pyridoxamine 5'-phosphate oxidase [Burkholderiales bacterium]